MQLKSSIWATILFLIIYFFTGAASGTPDNLADPGSPSFRPGQASTASKSNSLEGKVIVIDPGHGGYNTGAVGASGRTFEKTNVLFIAKDLKNMLEKAGAKVIMTRDSDISPEFGGMDQLESRVAIANSADADIFVSIHNDSNQDRTIVGTTTYYYGSGESRRLAESIQYHLVKQLGSRNHGTKIAPFHVLKSTRMPAILVEVGFISNYWEEKQLADPAYRYKASLGIFNGIKDYFTR
ncbi:MAG: N-acetylmuramoyl-L-alanine amidase [Firmicutes bacterium]|nr:N-acetylmuramoyl-L-alanine amidase [Bacillota bacterium]